MATELLEDGELVNTFEMQQRRASALAVTTGLPKHLVAKSQQQTVANCLMIIAIADRWDMDAFSVAAESYEVHGKIGFQGKLIAGVVNSRGNLRSNLNFRFEGKGADRTVTVLGTFKSEDEPRTVELSVGQAKTQNEMWTKDPDQKLCYSGAIRWARRHCPELILGVPTVEELEEGPHYKTESTKRIRESTLNETLAPQSEPIAAAIKHDEESPGDVTAPLMDVLPRFDECESVTDANALADLMIEQYTGDGQRELIESSCELRCGEIKASRGENSNKREE